MCPVHNDQRKKEVSLEEFKIMLHNVKKAYKHYPYLPIVWFSGGEIFLTKDIAKILDFTDASGFRYGFSTNGTLLNKNLINKILKHNLVELRFPLDGNEETHDKNRGMEGAYKKVINAIEQIKEIDKKSPVRITSPVSPRNRNLNHVLDIGKRFGIDVHFQHLLFIKRKELNKYKDKIRVMERYVRKRDFQFNFEDDFCDKDINKLWDEIVRLRKRRDFKNWVFFTPNIQSKKALFDYYKGGASEANADRIRSLATIAKIFPDGFMPGSGYEKDDNLLHNSLNKIWNNKRTRAYRTDISSLGLVPRVFPISCH
jgi:MoaA/NifB/PqqE/SkfB family radical SAM enzyme